MIHVLIPSRNCEKWLDRCLDSVAGQTHSPDRVIVIDDASDDPAYVAHVRDRCDELDFRFWANPSRLWALHNIYQGVWRLEPEPDDVIFILDGDDFLPPHALERIAEVYEDPEAWLTYGNYEPYPHSTGQTLAHAYAPDVIAVRSFRQHPLGFNHPLTFRYKLWRELPVAQLMLDGGGDFFEAGYDLAIMVPLLEMSAPDHFRFLDETLYYYNAVNPDSDVHHNAQKCAETGRIVMSRPQLKQWTDPVGVIDHALPRPYGLSETYELGARFLWDCEVIEDWGCGRGWFRETMRSLGCPAAYVGVDVGVDSVPGTNPFADIHADLREYRSVVPGIFMRHVLEHNHDWKTVLRNAIESFTQHMFLVLFTPWSDTGKTEVLEVNRARVYGGNPCPTLSFDRNELIEVVADVGVEVASMATETWFGTEHIVRLSK